MIVSTPVIPQATSSHAGDPTSRLIAAETIKMPDPIMEPATIMVESNSPSPRTKPVALSSGAVAVADMIVLEMANSAGVARL